MGGTNGSNSNMFGAFSMPPNNGMGNGGGLNMPMNMGAMQSMMYMGVPQMASMYNPSTSNSVDELGSAAIEFPPELGGDPPKLTASSSLNSGSAMDPSAMMGMNSMMATGMNPHMYLNPGMQQMQYNPMFGGYPPQNLNMMQQQHQMMQQQQYLQFMQQNMINMNNNQQGGNNSNPGTSTSNNNMMANPTPQATPPPPAATPSASSGATTNAGGSWRSPSDDPQRKDVIGRIIRFLQMQKPNAPPDWIRRLPQMARKLEEALYRKASSKPEYNDMNTLQQRLHVVAQEFKNKDWRSADDNGIRQDLIHRIVMLLRAQNPNATPDWINRLPHMAKKLEEMLYQKATSKAEYTDNARLKERLQVVATEIHKNNQKKAAKVPPDAPTTASALKMEALGMPAELRHPFLDIARAIASYLTPRTITEYNHKVLTMIQNIGQHRVVLMRQQQRLMQLKHACECHADKCAHPACAEMKPLWAHIQTCPESENCATPHCVSSNTLPENIIRDYHQKVDFMMNDSSQAQHQSILHRQQQRLLELRHASECKADKCAHPACAEMKPLWTHVVTCRQADTCPTPHCVSSKYVLAHYQHCMKPHCVVCLPLRDVKKADGSGGGTADKIRQFTDKAKGAANMLTTRQIQDYHAKVLGMMHVKCVAQNQTILERQQQRLLHLRHALFCPAEKCAATYCAEMKKLWSHVMGCKKSESCAYAHCLSSKYVLSHFQQCTNPACVVCALVRDAHEMEKAMAEDARANMDKKEQPLAPANQPVKRGLESADTNQQPPSKKQALAVPSPPVAESCGTRSAKADNSQQHSMIACPPELLKDEPDVLKDDEFAFMQDIDEELGGEVLEFDEW
ncbi:hypothetical protein DYB37_009233 [Aphanomyces astaci]|uniref:histone acetyltransferase n=1 Tax=Aphanomyces astaci TaxID=112090 RepID=A0A3R7AMI5_APHAT|nr:hypothetical protein DYB35_006084 [Aphanomyces astaci]RHZ10533.1 hypothetical protein DYB37_009233 [Aphanomyces astaci]